ncbi:MAG: prepilin-type N-terminal cleavage/methylation domain-containing protein [Nitrospinae bacterium]|nr:prepilin-type N-terminal cleavage/methylation domain-containing protein [Nitrospinota bacterium]
MNHEVRERGFTLLEILVAVTILAVSFTAIFHLYGGTLRNIERSERHARAAVLGGEKLEELMARSPFPPVGEQGTFSGNPDYSYKTTVEEYKEPVGRKEKTAPRDAAERIVLYHLSVKVEWKDGETAKELVLNTLKTAVEANR